jgi:hypothetical protein
MNLRELLAVVSAGWWLFVCAIGGIIYFGWLVGPVVGVLGACAGVVSGICLTEALNCCDGLAGRGGMLGVCGRACGGLLAVVAVMAPFGLMLVVRCVQGAA